MALQTTGPISLDDIQTEFGGSNPIAISEYYGEDGVPSNGTISIGDFYGASSAYIIYDAGWWDPTLPDSTFQDPYILDDDGIGGSNALEEASYISLLVDSYSGYGRDAWLAINRSDNTHPLHDTQIGNYTNLKIEWEHLISGSGYMTSETGRSKVGADYDKTDGNVYDYYSESHTSSQPREVISTPTTDFANDTDKWLKIVNYFYNASGYSWERELRIYKIWLE